MKKQPVIELIRTAYLPSQIMPLKRPVVLFLGRSNAGKSSLLNALIRKPLAQVSKNPGKTRSINYYRYGKKAILIDFPGFGYAKINLKEKSRWYELAKVFFEKLPKPSFIFILSEAKRSLGAEEFGLMESLSERGHKIHLLVTKSDRLNQKMKKEREDYFREVTNKIQRENMIDWRFVSIKNGEGLKEIFQILVKNEK